MAAIDFILKDKVIIAIAETLYVIDGPKVQYEAQAEKNHSDLFLISFIKDPS